MANLQDNAFLVGLPVRVTGRDFVDHVILERADRFGSDGPGSGRARVTAMVSKNKNPAVFFMENPL